MLHLKLYYLTNCNLTLACVSLQCLSFAPELVAAVANGVDPTDACTTVGLCDTSSKYFLNTFNIYVSKNTHSVLHIQFRTTNTHQHILVTYLITKQTETVMCFL